MSKNQLDKELRLGNHFLEYYSGKGSGTHAYRVLKRIFEFACSQNATRHEDGSVTFSWRDIQTSEDLSDDGKRLKKYLKEGIAKWESHYEMLNQYAVDQELEHYPTITLAEVGGGSGNVTRYKIELCPVSLDSAQDKKSLEQGYISYTPEMSDTKNPIIRFVDGLTAKGIKLHLMVSTLLTGIISGLLVVLVGLYLVQTQTSTFGLLSLTLDLAFIIGAIYLLFSPLYFCITKRIIMAPTMLSPLNHYSTQLEYTPTEEKRKDGSPIRQFRIVSYVGKCIVCGGRVDVEKGKKYMAGRLIGQCSNSPVEHVYSFDHISKLGKLIHEEYIDIKSHH